MVSACHRFPCSLPTRVGSRSRAREGCIREGTATSERRGSRKEMDRKNDREREKRISVKENLHRAALEKKIIITSLLNGTSDS